MKNISSQQLNTLCQIALSAGQAILDIYEKGNFAQSFKDDKSPLTEADLKADLIIRERLEIEFPEIFILSEESVVNSDIFKHKDERVFFLVDPLDGTKEFIKRNGEFTVNIALINNGKPVAGVVYAPVMGELFFAAQGLGAWKVKNQGKAIQLRTQSRIKDDPLRVIGSRSHGSKELECWLESLDEKYVFLAVGSSLKFCRIAEGVADVYPRFGPTSQWDTAAGQCVLENAGGYVNGSEDGKSLVYGLDRSIINQNFIAAASPLPYLSIIVPFSIKKKSSSHIFERAISFFDMSFPEWVEIIFVDSSPELLNSIDIKNKCDGDKYIYCYSEQPSLYSLGRARNDGAVVAKGKFLLFIDVDFIFHDRFFCDLYSKIKSDLEGDDNYAKFIMLPAFYLNEKTTNSISKRRDFSLFNEIRESVLEGDNSYVSTIAVSSSTIVLRLSYFLQIGGFNTVYKGHGREEFDLLHRLSINYPIGVKPTDYYIDEAHRFPASYHGFRKYFSYYSLPLVFSSLFLLHLYHDRPASDSFYKNKINNSALFQKNIRLYDSGMVLPPLRDFTALVSLRRNVFLDRAIIKLEVLNDFILRLMSENGYSRIRHPGLFCYKSGVVPDKSTLLRKINKFKSRVIIRFLGNF